MIASKMIGSKMIGSATDVRTRVDELIGQTVAATGRPLELWPADVREKFTLEALLPSVEHACRSPFYQAKFGGRARPASLAEFRLLPFTHPHEIKGRLHELLACPWEQVRQINLSSGTTAGPTTYVAYAEQDLRGDGAHYAPAGLFAFAPAELVFVALPYDMATVGFSLHRDLQRQDACVLPAGKGGTYSSPERLVQAIRELEPCTLFSTPSYAWYLSELFALTFPGAHRPLQHLRVGGEGASPVMLARLGDRWGADVRQWYGSTEIGIIAYSCERGTYHVTSGSCYIEVVDDSGEPVPPGTPGQIVLTALGRVATPFVRYACGDRGFLHADPCPCGRTLPALRMLGRAADQIPAPSGPVSPYLVEELLLQALPTAEPWYHIELRDDGIALVAEWPAREGPGGEDGVTAALRDRARAAAGLELAAIDWVEPGTLDRPWTKMRRVKDMRTGNTNGAAR
jgi:phenylacetate-CoA ligase